MGERLGPYELDKRIGAGGMADVFLARGPSGVCVIKRPHPHLTANAEFVRMFLDEASLLAQLNHPNIAQIFDLGHVGDTYYLAMEYVPGFDLMTISLEHERQGELMAAELCARIVADVAGALQYAHTAKGRNGQPLNIVHRDVSPHNVLLSTKGVVKLIDFGVARASTGTHKTQAGLVKGKYPYMSPEQVMGLPVDARTDVYALGLVLYELLTNVRAIAGNTEVEQIDNARSARIRPIEQLRPNVTMPIRQILAGCVHPQVEGRYPTAQAVKDDLEKYLSYERHVVGQEDLLRLFRVVAAESGHLDITQPDPNDSARPTQLEQPTPAVVSQSGTPDDDGSLAYSRTLPSMQRSDPGLAAAHPPAQPTQMELEANTAPESIPDLAPAAIKRSPVVWLVPLVAVAVIGAAGWALFGPKDAPPPVPVKPPVTVAAAVPDAAAVEPVAVVEPHSPVAVEPTIGDSGAAAAEPEVAHAPDVAQAPEVGNEPVREVRAAVVLVEAEPECDIAVDGKFYRHSPGELELMPGRHVVVLTNKESKFRKQFTLDLKPGERRPLKVRAEQGSLQITVVPFGEIRVDGASVAPGVSYKELQVWEGRHVVEAVLNDPSGVRRKKATVDVKANGSHPVTLNLME